MATVQTSLSLAGKNTEALATTTDLSPAAVTAIEDSLRQLLADVFTLYLKTKGFHWHMSGAHFRDYHLLLDEQAAAIFEMTDPLAERARKIGATTLRSIGEIAKYQRLLDHDGRSATPKAMLEELFADNQCLTRSLREAHTVCEKFDDVATASLLENWIDEAERRTWFLYETVRDTK